MCVIFPEMTPSIKNMKAAEDHFDERGLRSIIFIFFYINKDISPIN